MARTIKLRWACSRYVYGKDDGIRIRFDVEYADGVSPKIFGYRMLPKDPYGGREGHFSHICSPVDLAEFPEDAPTPGFSPEWFRLSFVDVEVRSLQEAQDFIDVVLEDVRRILHTLNTMEEIVPAGEETIGDALPDPWEPDDSESASEADSESLGATQSIARTGTTEQSVGVGVPWEHIGEGAGSPIAHDDEDSLSSNSVEEISLSRVTLLPGETSQLLLIQGFDLSELPKHAIVSEIEPTLTLRAVGVFADCPVIRLLAVQHSSYGMGEDHGGDLCVNGPDFYALTYTQDANGLWGLNPVLGKHLRDGAFGVGLVIANDSSSETVVVEIDGAAVTIFFAEYA